MTVPIPIPLMLHGAVIFGYITGRFFFWVHVSKYAIKFKHMDAYGLYSNDIK
jgi:hypothetical protein